jgi:hypothetical protein
MKRLTTPQLITVELLLGKECTLQGKPRAWPRTLAQNLRLGIPPEHKQALLEIRFSKPSMSPKLQAMLLKLHQQEIQDLNTTQ